MEEVISSLFGSQEDLFWSGFAFSQRGRTVFLSKIISGLLMFGIILIYLGVGKDSARRTEQAVQSRSGQMDPKQDAVASRQRHSITFPASSGFMKRSGDTFKLDSKYAHSFGRKAH